MLLTLGCSHLEQPSSALKVSNIELLPSSEPEHYLAWERNGNIIWLDEDLRLLNSKKLDVYSLQQILLLTDGLLLITEVLENNEITEELIKLSFSGDELHHWSKLPDSITSLSTQQNTIRFIGFMGDEYQLTDKGVIATENTFHQQAAVITIDATASIVCKNKNADQAAQCSRKGSNPWIKEGLWGGAPILCSDYLVEDTFHQTNNNTDNWKYAIRDVSTGKIINVIKAPNVSFTRCLNNQLVTIGETINTYSLPSAEPTSSQKCAGSSALDAIITDNKNLVCISDSGELKKQQLNIN